MGAICHSPAAHQKEARSPHLPSVSQAQEEGTGFQAVCSPTAAYDRRESYHKGDGEPFFCRLCNSKRWERTGLCPPLGTSFAALLWIRRLIEANDINSYPELSAGELPQEPWPLRGLLRRARSSRDKTREPQCRGPSCLCHRGGTSDSAGFPQPLTCSVCNYTQQSKRARVRPD